jgi:type II secretory pathway pseudopilin PulG
MAGVMVLLAIMMIFSTIAFQSWEEVLRRDNEAEMMFRAQEIVRAIQRYRADRGNSPGKLEDLLEPGSKAQYFIRHRYVDALTEDGKWGLLYAGPGGQVIDPNAELFQESALDIFGSEALSGKTSNLSRDQREALQRRQAAGRRHVKWDPFRTKSKNMFEKDEESMAGGKVLQGLPIAGVKSLSQDLPFRVYKGNSFYTDWHFTFMDLEKGLAGGRNRQQQQQQQQQPRP